jgi:arylsulfatase A-like enzyme
MVSLFSMSLVCATGTAVASRPHIVMIVADDLGYGDLGYTGNSEIPTPRIDEIAASGRVLQNYYVQPTCSPTRASIHTGRYCMRYGMDMATAAGPHGVPLNETFLPEVLKKEGYHTHAVGKWHLGGHAWEFTPAFRGYMSYLGFYNGGESYFDHAIPWFPKRADHDYDFSRQTGERCGEGCSTVELSANNHYSTHILTAEAERLIDAHDPSEPFFLYLAYQAVHGPDQAPLMYVEPFAAVKDEKRRVYSGMLTALDEGIGNVTKALKAKAMWENTFLIFTADNGGPTDMCMTQGSTNTPLRGGKCSVYEGGTRGTAFIGGGAVAASVLGQPFPHLMHAVDWLPTLASLAGVENSRLGNITNFPLDGVNQANSLFESAEAGVREEVFYGFSGAARNGSAIRTTRWKLLRGEPYNGAPVPFPSFFTPNYTLSSPRGPSYVTDSGDGSLLGQCSETTQRLFDLSAGEAEQDEDDVAAQYPEVVRELAGRLDAYVAQASTGDPSTSTECATTQPKNKNGPDGRNAITPYCVLDTRGALLV